MRRSVLRSTDRSAQFLDADLVARGVPDGAVANPVDMDVMSVSLRGIGDAPVVYYTDPLRMFAHLNDVHGADAVNGMAMLMAWSQAPTRAMGRFEAARPPKSLDEMYACATNEFERSSITDLLFASVTDVLDRYLPDNGRHGALRGMLAFLAANTTYRGPATPGSAAALAFGLAVPDENAVLMRKLRGGIGTLTAHLEELFTSGGGELRLRSEVTEILSADGGVTGVRIADGSTFDAPIVVSCVAPDLTLTSLVSPEAAPADVRERFSRVDHRGSYVQMHFALDGAPKFAEPYGLLNDPTMQAAIGLFSTPEELQQQWEDCRRGIVPADPAVAFQIPSAQDPDLAPPGKHAASAFSLWFPIEADRADHARLKAEMGQCVIDKITRLAPDFEGLITKHTTFTPRHMGTMFGAPGGDYCHGLIHPEQMGPNRAGPRGHADLPLGIEGLYLGSAGCHGGPGITFIPGYNAATQALADKA
jgi:phytoene dehydrogenase-like protein